VAPLLFQNIVVIHTMSLQLLSQTVLSGSRSGSICGAEIPILVAGGDLVRLEQGTLHSTTETLSLLQSTGLVMYSNQRQALQLQ
jgi:hypothetical protein